MLPIRLLILVKKFTFENQLHGHCELYLEYCIARPAARALAAAALTAARARRRASYTLHLE